MGAEERTDRPREKHGDETYWRESEKNVNERREKQRDTAKLKAGRTPARRTGRPRWELNKSPRPGPARPAPPVHEKTSTDPGAGPRPNWTLHEDDKTKFPTRSLEITIFWHSLSRL